MGDWLPNGLEAAYYALLIGVIVFTAVKERARRRSAVSRKVALGVRAAKLQLAKDAERKVTRAEKDLAEFQARQSREDRRSASSRTVDDVPDAALPSETQDAATSDGHATPGVNVEEQLRTYRIQATNYMRDGLWCLFECASGDEGDHGLCDLPPFIEHVDQLRDLADLSQKAADAYRDTLARIAGDAALRLLREQRATAADARLRGRLRARGTLKGEAPGTATICALRSASIVRARLHQEDKEHAVSLGVLADALRDLPEDRDLWAEVSELARKAYWSHPGEPHFDSDGSEAHTDTRQREATNAHINLLQPD